MHLDSVNADALDPRPLADFWAAALGIPHARSDDGGAALALPGCDLELWFLRDEHVQPVDERRLHFDLGAVGDDARDVERLLSLGARPLDIGQGDVDWTVLADPAGNAFCVLPPRGEEFRDAGELACLLIDSADPARDREFWRLASGWRAVQLHDAPALRHPSGAGLVIAFYPEPRPKTAAKNWLHLDLRLDPGDDEAAELRGLVAAGASRVDHDWGELDWHVLADPSGNEFCVLRAT